MSCMLCMQVTVSGYNHKLPQLLDAILDKITGLQVSHEETFVSFMDMPIKSDAAQLLLPCAWLVKTFNTETPFFS